MGGHIGPVGQHARTGRPEPGRYGRIGSAAIADFGKDDGFSPAAADRLDGFADGLFMVVSAGGVIKRGLCGVGAGGETGKSTLEETLKLAQVRTEIVAANEGAGSGTPYLDADGILGSTVIAGAIFGGIAGALFFRGRSGKYAAQGRG